MQLKFKLFLSYFIFLLCLNSLAQSNELDLVNRTYDSLTENLFTDYSGEISESSRIFNGPEYFYDDIIIGGNPFWGTRQFHNGSVFYEKVRYDNQEIGYDIYRDEIFISRYDQNGILSKINLSDTKVDGFMMEGHTFIRLNEVPDEADHPGEGYYEVLLKGEGELNVIAKRSKRIMPANDGGLYKYEFQVSDKLYVQKDTIYQRIFNRKNLINLLKDKKKSIRTYYRNHKTEFLDLEDYVVGICSYYEQIK